MNQRFIITTFAACIFMFAAIFALTAPASLPRPAAKADAAPASPEAVMYADCNAVRAANAAPLRAGQPGYRPALDANMNGVACETVGGAPAPAVVGTSPSTAAPPPADVAPPADFAPQPPVEAPSPPSQQRAEPITLT
ncbi:hypothetical protein ASG11_16915 [Sphingomonas sp. Leaf357]|uniref:excalibur calcium-binding domain-containing protein n=1 Tax=Sphingomonas sp. Leaf357 TaxID=1736350 RepID=UPI0006F7E362|nr:excalibur calcium-binding domain-containing protein [Sphingomonas sp. Leaf357]KQS01366.1 hypothetical protein ASG11_16915 [Sphingomonas sp. Leaf357]